MKGDISMDRGLEKREVANNKETKESIDNKTQEVLEEETKEVKELKEQESQANEKESQEESKEDTQTEAKEESKEQETQEEVKEQEVKEEAQAEAEAKVQESQEESKEDTQTEAKEESKEQEPKEQEAKEEAQTKEEESKEQETQEEVKEQEVKEEAQAEAETKAQESQEESKEENKAETKEESKEQETQAKAKDEAKEQEPKGEEAKEETKAELKEDTQVKEEQKEEKSQAEAEAKVQESQEESKEDTQTEAKEESKEQESQTKEEATQKETKEDNEEDILSEESSEFIHLKKEAISTGDKAKLVEYKILRAKELIDKSESKIREWISDVEAKVNSFKEYERGHLSPLINNSRQLLEKIGIKGVKVNEEPSIDMKIKDIEERLEIEEPPSGVGLALSGSIISGILVVIGWCALISKKLGMPVPPKEVPDLATINKLLASISDMFGQGENTSIGIAIVAGSALVVMWLVYTIIMSIKVSTNIQRAEEIEKEALKHSKEKLSHKNRIQDVKGHIDNLEDVVKSYEVILAELNATLTRALHIEKAKSFDELHNKTKEAVSELQHLLKELDELLSSPISKEGSITKESKEALAKAKKAIDDYIAKIYK